jgi:hypothetical protein
MEVGGYYTYQKFCMELVLNAEPRYFSVGIGLRAGKLEFDFWQGQSATSSRA